MNKFLDKIMPFAVVAIIIMFVLVFVIPLLFLNGAAQ